MYLDQDLRDAVDQLAAGRHALALELVTLAADRAAEHADRHAAVVHAAQLNLQLDRPYEAIGWIERLRTLPDLDDDAEVEADLLEAVAMLAIGETADALALLTAPVSPASVATPYADSYVHELRCRAHAARGEVDEAVTAAFTALLDGWELPGIWQALTALAATAPVDLDDALARVEPDGLLRLLSWIVDGPIAGIDAVIDAAWTRWPADPRLVAVVATVGSQLPLERAIDWSVRLRAAGVAEHCALLGVATDEQRPVTERLRAAALAAAAFEDPRAEPVLELAVTAVDDGDLPAAFAELLELAPDDLLDVFVVAAASTPRRSLLLAGDLLGRGAIDPALALTRHALEQTTGRPEALRLAVAQSLTPDVVSTLASALSDRGTPELASRVLAAR